MDGGYGTVTLDTTLKKHVELFRYHSLSPTERRWAAYAIASMVQPVSYGRLTATSRTMLSNAQGWVSQRTMLSGNRRVVYFALPHGCQASAGTDDGTQVEHSANALLETLDDPAAHPSVSAKAVGSGVCVGWGGGGIKCSRCGASCYARLLTGTPAAVRSGKRW